MSDKKFPPPPPGFVVEGGSASVPPPPPGFVMEGHGASIRPGNAVQGNAAARPTSQQASDQYQPGTDDAANVGILSGMTANFGDEIMAGLMTPIEIGMQVYRGDDVSVGGAYDEALRKNREYETRSREASPVAATVGDVAGGLATGGTLAKGGATFLNATKPTYAQLMGRGAAEGAVYGAAYGAGAGEGGADRLRKSAQGAAIGGATGGALGAVGARQASKKTKPSRVVERALRDDGLTPETAKARMQELGPDAMLADLGPNLQRQAGGLASIPGKGQKTVRDAITKRQEGASGRVTQTANKVLGRESDIVATIDDVILKRKEAAAPAYQKAYDDGSNAIWSPELERLSGAPSIQRAMRSAVSSWQDRAIADGFGAMNPGALVDRGGILSFKNGKVPAYPDLQFWDYTKNVMDDMVQAAIQGGKHKKAQALTKMTQALRNELDKAVPSYQAARNAYAGPTKMIEAAEKGQKVFTRAMTPGQLKKELADLTDSERESFQQGVRSALSDLMGTARNDALKARQIFDQGYNREKLRMLVGKDRANELLRRLDSEKAFTATRDVVTSNSETAARQAARKELEGETGAPGIIRSAMNFQFGDAAGKAGDKILGRTAAARRADVNEQVANMLTSRAFKSAVPMLSNASGGLWGAAIRLPGQQGPYIPQ